MIRKALRGGTCNIARILRLQLPPEPPPPLHDTRNRNHERSESLLKSGSYTKSQLSTGMLEPEQLSSNSPWPRLCIYFPPPHHTIRFHRPTKKTTRVFVQRRRLHCLTTRSYSFVLSIYKRTKVGKQIAALSFVIGFFEIYNRVDISLSVHCRQRVPRPNIDGSKKLDR